MPTPPMVPSYSQATYLGRMHERHGGTYMGMQQYAIQLPFIDGRRSHVGNWWYHVQANVSATVMDVGGGLDLRRNELLDISLPVTVVRPLRRGRDLLMFTIMPRYSGDTVSAAHAWDVGAVAAFRSKVSDSFTFSLGMATMPRFMERPVMPYIAFSWQPTPDWLVRMRGFQLATLYQVAPHLNVGPMLSGTGGTWMVSTPKGQNILRVRSLVAGLLAEYDFAPPGSTPRVLALSVGSTLATATQFCNRTAHIDAYRSHHYKPGLAMSLELDFRF